MQRCSASRLTRTSKGFGIPQRIGDFLGRPFLRTFFQPAGRSVHDRNQLGESGDAAPLRLMTDMGDAPEGQEVVVAQGREGDITHPDDIAVIHVALLR